MVNEVDYDLSVGSLSFIETFIELTQEKYASILKYEFKFGDEVSLGNHFNHEKIFREYYTNRFRKNGEPYKVRSDMHISHSEDEFNRYYIRALCRKKLEWNGINVEIYRAKDSENHRPESDRRIGLLINAQNLLIDLRENVGNETKYEIPEYRSGLSVKLTK